MNYIVKYSCLVSNSLYMSLADISHRESLPVSTGPCQSLAVSNGHCMSLAVSTGPCQSLEVSNGHCMSLAVSAGPCQSLTVTACLWQSSLVTAIL